MAASLNPGARSVAGPERYWAPCLAVALLAMFLFYVTLQDLVRESAARAPVPVAVMPARVEVRPPPDMAEGARQAPVQPARPVRTYALAAADAPQQPAGMKRVKTVEVSKCLTPSGEAEYSDGPCPEGAQATKLRLRQD